MESIIYFANSMVTYTVIDPLTMIDPFLKKSYNSIKKYMLLLNDTEYIQYTYRIYTVYILHYVKKAIFLNIYYFLRKGINHYLEVNNYIHLFTLHSYLRYNSK